MERINKKHLVEEVKKHLEEKGLEVKKNHIGETISSIFEIIVQAIESDKAVAINGFGTFKKSKSKARVGVNPRNPEEKINIPARSRIKFSQSLVLKERLNK